MSEWTYQVLPQIVLEVSQSSLDKRKIAPSVHRVSVTCRRVSGRYITYNSEAVTYIIRSPRLVACSRWKTLRKIDLQDVHWTSISRAIVSVFKFLRFLILFEICFFKYQIISWTIFFLSLTPTLRVLYLCTLFITVTNLVVTNV